MPDFYGILEVESTASQTEIRGAYRRLARKFHPDLAGAGSSADRMAILNEAYDVLGDPRKRQLYDFLRRRSFAAPMPLLTAPAAKRRLGVAKRLVYAISLLFVISVVTMRLDIAMYILLLGFVVSAVGMILIELLLPVQDLDPYGLREMDGA